MTREQMHEAWQLFLDGWNVKALAAKYDTGPLVIETLIREQCKARRPRCT